MGEELKDRLGFVVVWKLGNWIRAVLEMGLEDIETVKRVFFFGHRHLGRSEARWERN